MKISFKNRSGSLTVISIFIFLFMMVSITLMLTFSTLQASLSRNQLEKIQSRYKVEDGLNKLLYKEENVDELIKGQILRRYRTGWTSTYEIEIEKGHELRSYIEKANFNIRKINDREVISFDIESKHNNLTSNITAYGPCINELFELNKTLFDEKSLLEAEIPLFTNFIDKMENQNWDYDFNMGSNYKKINTKNDIAIKFVSERVTDNFKSPKTLIKNYNEVNQISEPFTLESVIIHLKRDDVLDRSLTIGSTESDGLITMQGVLYLEGDLIINQGFEFQGLIIINDGKIIINSEKKPIIKGMIINKGEEIEENSIDLIHDQLIIYKAGSFLPGFLDIDIEVVKKY